LHDPQVPCSSASGARQHDQPAQAGAIRANAGALTAHALGVNPTLVMRMSGRTSYSTADEREAEMMATIIRQRIYRERESPPRQPEKGSDSWDALFAQPIKKGRFRSR
ncbi:hypothetical protein, partial [Streptomyces europaeiscabiei]|uniref:hypothetical protein n=1 Tax=Streptomyces europaeiscabiei TaxID=146819 RepID=UPI0029B8BAB8